MRRKRCALVSVEVPVAACVAAERVACPLAPGPRAEWWGGNRGRGNSRTVRLRPASPALLVKDDSDLLRHELAYVLGQMRAHSAIGTLTAVLRDVSDNSMVRHESAEALGAIGDASVLPVLREFLSDPLPEVSETCEVAIGLLEWKEEQKQQQAAAAEGAAEPNPYLSVDPAPAAPKEKSVEEMKSALLNESLPLFKRYRAMFGLRNRGGEAAAKVRSPARPPALPLAPPIPCLKLRG